MTEPACACVVDEDGVYLDVCANHYSAACSNEYRVRDVLDRELDAVVRELAGRAPTRIERKVGAVGMFAVTRPAP